MEKLIQTIKTDIEKYNITYLRLQFIDLLGKTKNVEVPVRKLEEVLEGKVLFDGSSIQGFTRIHEADMLLKADPTTWQVLHFEKTLHETGVGRFICDVLSPDGTAFDGDPRNVLKRAIEELEDFGFSAFNVGLEPEFYLFKSLPHDTFDIELSDKGGYFDQSPIDESEDCRREIVYELERMNYLVEASHHEVGPGQNEVTWKYDNALTTADKLTTFKTVVRQVARRHGMYATFMPKPFSTLAGNGMHSNLSLFTKDGKNAFYDETTADGLSETAHYFIGGILKHATSFAAISNSTVNSYKRLVPGYEAPCYVAYATRNRSALVRIPASRGLGTRVEVRCPDPLANPYLLLAVLLRAGLDGIKNKTRPGEAIGEDIFDFDADQIRKSDLKHLPVTLLEALTEMQKSDLVKDTLGEHVYGRFLQAKLHEWDHYHVKVSRWELNKYFAY